MIIKRSFHTSPANHKFVRFIWWPYFKRWQDLERDVKKESDEDYKLQHAFRPTDDLYLTPEKREDILPKKALADQTRRDFGAMPLELMTDHTQLRYMDHSFDNKRRVKRYEEFQVLQYDQRFIAERFLFLGADLAAAHFLVRREASVKFVGDDTWYTRRGAKELPKRKVEGLYIEAIDASNTEFMFEGFDNLYDLKHLRLLRLADCPYIDDWSLSRIGGVFGPSLEYLDVSNCKRISGKGLMGLRSLSGLKELRLGGLNNQLDLCKSALLLEAALLDLNITGLDFEKALEEMEAEEQLLRDDRAVIDAKGNVFVEDDKGELFYVKGKITEKANVNDEDQPLVTSTIRRDLPEMDEVEFERLDRLAKGRLRHQLVGSPSGYIWSDQVETILSHEHKLNKRLKVPTDPKMLPLTERLERFKEMGVDMDKLIEEQSKKLHITSKEEAPKIESGEHKEAHRN